MSSFYKDATVIGWILTALGLVAITLDVLTFNYTDGVYSPLLGALGFLMSFVGLVTVLVISMMGKNR